MQEAHAQCYISSAVKMSKKNLQQRQSNGTQLFSQPNPPPVEAQLLSPPVTTITQDSGLVQGGHNLQPVLLWEGSRAAHPISQFPLTEVCDTAVPQHSDGACSVQVTSAWVLSQVTSKAVVTICLTLAYGLSSWNSCILFFFPTEI